jgi:response regulator RpfG family c-di-GMP phosphodiesterase
MMPGKDGFEVCSILKNNPATRDIPIILLTALNAREDINKGIERGVDDFISKPFIEKELLFRVSSLLRIKDLNNYIGSQDIFIRDFEEMTTKLLSDNERKGSNIEQYIIKLIDRILIPGSAINRTPEGVYLSLTLSGQSSTEMYFSVDEGVISRKEHIIPISRESISPAGIWKNNVLISNWQKSAADNPDDYQAILPKELVAEAGEVRNFLYSEGEMLKIILVNFHNDIQVFDITMFQHLVTLSRTIIKILGHMKKSEDIYYALSNSISRITEIRDGSEGKHARVGKICEMLCHSLECGDVFTSQILEAVALFDIGKLLIDQSVLLKKGPLSNSELEDIHRIPEFAERILDSEPRLLAAREIASGLYEKWDGSGYPHGKKGEEIPFSARIVALVNTYDSLRCIRAYRKGYSHSAAVKIISIGDERVKPEHFDPRILSAFIHMEPGIKEYYDTILPGEKE